MVVWGWSGLFPRTYEGGGRNDDSEPNDATDNSMCELVSSLMSLRRFVFGSL